MPFDTWLVCVFSLNIVIVVVGSAHILYVFWCLYNKIICSLNQQGCYCLLLYFQCCFIFLLHSKSCLSSFRKASSPFCYFIKSRCHLVMASVPPVIMAGEQELNQQGIISQCAPGGNTASHATIAFLLVTLTAWKPLTPHTLQHPHGLSPVSVPGHTCDTALKAQLVPSCSGAYFRIFMNLKRKWWKKWRNGPGLCACFMLPHTGCVIFFQFSLLKQLLLLLTLLPRVGRWSNSI